MIFALGPGEIGGPVQTPAGWNLLLVQDVREAQNDDLSQPRTRKQTRRKYIHEKLDEYVVNLRKNEFPVEVYEDRLIALAQQEADMVARLTEQGQFDERGFLDDLRQGRIGAVIGASDLTAGPGEFSNWSRGMRAALQQHYKKADTLGYLSVWLPQGNP